MTYDKAVFYLSNQRILDAINDGTESELRRWLGNLNSYLLERYPKGECSYPIECIAEMRLLKLRLGI